MVFLLLDTSLKHCTRLEFSVPSTGFARTCEERVLLRDRKGSLLSTISSIRQVTERYEIIETKGT